jgi:uncharacterized protein YndB with AHSA1/START domain
MAANEARAVADAEQGMVLATVEIAAPPERVFEALVRSEDVLRWWGSEGVYRTTKWEADVRPGGKWRAGGKMEDGREYVVEGEYTVVAPPYRLVFTWRPDWDSPHETRVTYLLEELDEGTRVTLRHEGFANREAVCRSHGSGWQRVLGWLEKDLRPKPAPARYFLFRLHPPRPTFIRDMTAEEMALMKAHGAYWKTKLDEGKVIAFGPVADPAGSWGMGLLRVADAAEVEGLTQNDPVMLANQGFRYEVLPMPQAVHA